MSNLTQHFVENYPPLLQPLQEILEVEFGLNPTPSLQTALADLKADAAKADQNSALRQG